MNRNTRTMQPGAAAGAPRDGFLRRQCACGAHTFGASTCAHCGTPRTAAGVAGIQAKLRLGAVDDPLEAEADRIGEQVLAAPQPGMQGTRAAPPAIRRAAGAYGPPAPEAATASVEPVLAGSSAPLEATLRQDMESRFGRDFSGVRVHADGAAQRSAHDIGARAYTAGQHVVFGAGEYAPASQAGRRLIAHELVHVVQQGAGAGPGTVRRFESPEHQDFGDQGGLELAAFLATAEGKQWLQQYKIDPAAVAGIDKDPLLQGKKIVVGTLALSPGDAIALMGDFYRTPKALMAAPAAEVAELLAAIKRERAGELGGGKANEAYQDITAKYRKSEDTFLQLAKVNNPHFTPGNRAEWTRMHGEAIAMVREGKQSPEKLQEALLIDASGGHFLTDAFASGHLFNKKEIEDQIFIHIRAKPPRAANPEMQGYLALSEGLGLMTNLVLKNIHDRLNTEGVDVSNKKGMSWRTYGDDRLKNAAATLRIGALAIYISRQQIIRAQKAGSPAPDPAEVLDLLPDADSVAKATAKAVSYIAAAADSVAPLIYRQRGGVKAGLASSLPPVIGPLAGSIIKANLSAIGNPGREKQLLDLKEREPRSGGPLLAPQFTLWDF